MMTVLFSGDPMKLFNVNQQCLQSGKYTTLESAK